MTNTNEFSCGMCDAQISVEVSRTSGVAYASGADPATHDGAVLHAADISHAFRHTPWCAECGADKGDCEHTQD